LSDITSSDESTRAIFGYWMEELARIGLARQGDIGRGATLLPEFKAMVMNCLDNQGVPIMGVSSMSKAPVTFRTSIKVVRCLYNKLIALGIEDNPQFAVILWGALLATWVDIVPE
jgi:hypothetical protein